MNPLLDKIKKENELRGQRNALIQKRKELRNKLMGHRDQSTAEYTADNEAYRSNDDALEALDLERDNLNAEIRSLILDQRVNNLPMAKDATADQRSEILASQQYSNAFFRSLAANKIADADAEIMDFGKRSVTDVNGGAITSGGEYLLPKTTIDNIYKITEQWGRVWAKVTKYGFAGVVSLPIGTLDSSTVNGDGVNELKFSFTETTIKQEAIIATIDLKKLLMRNSISALEGFLTYEIGKFIGLYLDNGVINGDMDVDGNGGSFRGILQWLDGSENSYTTFTYDVLCDIQGSLESPYGDDAVFIMRRSTFFKTVKKIKDGNNNPIVAAVVLPAPIGQKVGNTWFLEGQEVIFTIALEADDILYGDLSQYIANVSEGTTIERTDLEKFSKDYVTFKGKIYAGGTPISEAMCKQTFSMWVKDSDKVASPTFTPDGGAFADTESVEIACATVGATIYYTTNGNTPTNKSTKYTAAIDIAATTTIKAKAYKKGMVDSDVISKTFTKS